MSYDYNTDPKHQDTPTTALLLERIAVALEEGNRIAVCTSKALENANVIGAITAGALEALVAVGLRMVVSMERAPKQVIIVGESPKSYAGSDKEPWFNA